MPPEFNKYILTSPAFTEEPDTTLFIMKQEKKDAGKELAQQPAAWSAEAEAQQRGGVPADTLVPMALFRNAVESVVKATRNKKGAAGAKWALTVAEVMAASGATEDENETTI